MAYCPECAKEYPDDWKVCPQHESTLLASELVGKYKIEGVLGIGGMGAVYKGINPDTRAPVAIKMLHPLAAGDEPSRARFQREAASIAALSTRHLVTIYDFGAEEDGTLYLVMEFLLGHSLRVEIRDAEPMPIQRINLAMDGALRGLGAAHRKGIIHRDIKPENIFVADTEDGEVVKVLDFGVAQIQTSDPSSVITQEGALLGTPAYMAPEQVTGSRGELGAWTDVYAMGVILYEMLTGETPFAADSMTAVLSRVLSREFTPLSELRGDLPPPLLCVVDKAMADDAKDRYRHAEHFREEWLNAYHKLGPSITNATTPRYAGAVAKADDKADPFSGTAVADSANMLKTSAERPNPRPLDLSVTPESAVSAGPRRDSGGRSVGLVLAAIIVAGAFGGLLLMRGGNGKTKHTQTTTTDARVQSGPADAAPPKLDAAPQPAVVPDDMVRMAGGSFDVGVDSKLHRRLPQALAKHTVTLKPFFIDKTEVTVAAFKTAAALLKAKAPPLRGDQNRGQLPVRMVTWDEAAAICAALGKRLPTEAEWEYAATRYPLRPDGARLRQPGVKGPAKVGTYPGDCSPTGVCDLLGNVSEWTASAARTKHGADPSRRILRGGSYSVSPKSKFYASPHARMAGKPTLKDREVGFRCAKDVAN